MDSAMVMERMYYIIDGNGNYYRTNDEDQLIVSQGRDNADLFALKEANKRINSGRKMYFYSILPADTDACAENIVVLSEKANAEKATEEVTPQAEVGYEYDLDRLDWKEYLLHFNYIISGLKRYQDKLNNELYEVDMCICDLMHYLELYDLEDVDCGKAATMIKQYREKRRMIKDRLYMAETFQRAIGTNNNLTKGKEALALINKLDRRTYKPRVLSDIFTDTMILSKRAEDTTELQEEKHMELMQEQVIQEVRIERKETALDSGDTDWAYFAETQATFFADARQYACNLQITLNELDEEIEEIMNQIEDANCNVAQGYKVFKTLKDLRNGRKKVEKELECVQTIIGCFDCEAMRDAYEYCRERIGEIQN